MTDGEKLPPHEELLAYARDLKKQIELGKKPAPAAR